MKNDEELQNYKNLGWILNPGSTFPLTILKIDKATAMRIKSILDEEYSEETLQKLTPIFIKNEIRCKEIDDYVHTFKPIFEKQVNELISQSEEWANADEEERDDLQSGFEETAMMSLEIQTGMCDLPVIFSWPDVLIEYYYRQIAVLISHTYTGTQYATEEKNQSLGPDFRHLIKGIRISTAQDGCVCIYCKQLSEKSYSVKNYPNIPLHLGCRCTLLTDV